MTSRRAPAPRRRGVDLGLAVLALSGVATAGVLAVVVWGAYLAARVACTVLTFMTAYINTL